MEEIFNYKKKYLKTLANVNSLKNSWKVWEPEIRSRLSKNPTGSELLDLGDHLSDIFQKNSSDGRNQGSLSGGGAAWECLVTWYLNLICWNIPVVIIKQNKSYVPQIISDVLTVTISNSNTNTESDVIIFSIPEEEKLSEPKLTTLNDHLKSRLKDVDLVNLQCKTNWNDNAQVPMLWDMIYNSDSRLPNISVGINGVSPQSVKKFRYAFVTVPTVKTKFKSSTLAVLRVKNLTGGNYWGKRSEPDVVSSIKELPNRNFSSHFIGGICAHIDQTILDDPAYPENFLKLDW
jgi:hypothetical protein